MLSRYDAFKKGDYAAAANPIPLELSNNTTSQPDSLIDFDEGPPTTATNVADSTGGIGDLAGLFNSPSPPVLSQAPAFGNFGALTHAPAPTLAYNNNNNGFGALRLGGESGSGASSPFQPRQSVTPPAAIMLPTSPSPTSSLTQRVAAPPSMFGALSGTSFSPTQRNSSQSPHRAQLQTRPQSQPQSQPPPQPQQAPAKDPFADLAGLF